MLYKPKNVRELLTPLTQIRGNLSYR